MDMIITVGVIIAVGIVLTAILTVVHASLVMFLTKDMTDEEKEKYYDQVRNNIANYQDSPYDNGTNIG